MEQKKMTLDDVLKNTPGYEVDQYITAEDASLLRDTFRGNPKLLYALRKILLPSVGDSNLPIEQLQDDVWLSGVNWSQVPEKEIAHLAVARELAIKFIMGGLIKLKILASTPEETAQQKAWRLKRDSGK